MDEDTAIIDANTRNEKIKNFFLKNRLKLIIFFSAIIVILITYFVFKEITKNSKIKISEDFNYFVSKHEQGKSEESLNGLIKIINEKDPTYSPLSLYFLLDNDLITDIAEINNFFDILIDETSLENEIKNLIIYKKGLFNADSSDEVFLLEILKPVINSDSIWKSHCLYLIAEFFYSKNEKQKSKDFYQSIVSLDNANPDIKIKAQKRLNRDISD